MTTVALVVAAFALLVALVALGRAARVAREAQDGADDARRRVRNLEEQIEQESQALHHYLSYGTESYAEALTYFPEPESFAVGPEAYLELIQAAREAVDIPLIGSLNGYTPGGWTRYARMIEEAGASALELNLYHLETDLETTSTEVEE